VWLTAAAGIGLSCLTAAVYESVPAGGGGTGLVVVDGPPVILLLSEGKTAGQVETRVTIENHSDEPRHLKVLKTSCSCASAQLARSIIEPGDDVPLTVLLTAPDRGGRRTATVDLASTGAMESTFSVEVAAHFLDDLWLEPQTFRFGRDADSTGYDAVLHLRRRRASADNEVPQIRCAHSPTWVSYRLRSPEPVRHENGDFEELEWHLRLDRNTSATPSAQPFDRLVLTVDGTGSVQASCWGDFRTGIVVAPTGVTIPSAETGRSVTRRFVLRANDSVAFQVVSMSCSSADVRLESRDSNPRNVQLVDATITPREPGKHRYELVFETTHPLSPRVTVAVSVQVSAGHAAAPTGINPDDVSDR